MAKADDSTVVYAPPTLRLSASQAAELHLGTCGGSMECTALLVAAVARGEAGSK